MPVWNLEAMRDVAYLVSHDFAEVTDRDRALLVAEAILENGGARLATCPGPQKSVHVVLQVDSYRVEFDVWTPRNVVDALDILTTVPYSQFEEISLKAIPAGAERVAARQVITSFALIVERLAAKLPHIPVFNFIEFEAPRWGWVGATR